MSKVKLGDRVKDNISEFEGIVVGITTWLNGCARIGIQGKERTKDNLPTEAYWVDEVQREILKKDAFEKGSQDTGGPRPVSMRRSDPTNY